MYYRGDYYRGDYYRGSWLSSIGSAIGRLAGQVAPAAKFIPGISTAVAVGSAFGGMFGPAKPVTSSTPGAIKDPGLGGIISRMLPGGMTGYHRRRRMNVANVKALRRAIRRGRGFAKLAKSVMTYPYQKPPKGRALFKAKRRRAA